MCDIFTEKIQMNLEQDWCKKNFKIYLGNKFNHTKKAQKKR